MRRIAAVLAVGCVILLQSCGVRGPGNLEDEAERQASTYSSSLAQLMRSVEPLTNDQTNGVRIDYETKHCNRDFDGRLPLPEKGSVLSDGRVFDVSRISEFVVDRDYQKSGLLKIRIGKTDERLLSQKINLIVFDGSARDDPTLALLAVEEGLNSSGILQKTKMKRSYGVFDHWTVRAGSKLPQRLENISFEDALDRVALDFGGAVLFGICDRARLYYLDFSFVIESRPGA